MSESLLIPADLCVCVSRLGVAVCPLMEGQTAAQRTAERQTPESKGETKRFFSQVNGGGDSAVLWLSNTLKVFQLHASGLHQSSSAGLSGQNNPPLSCICLKLASSLLKQAADI